jgi:hypothetical protein
MSLLERFGALLFEILRGGYARAEKGECTREREREKCVHTPLALLAYLVVNNSSLAQSGEKST